MKGPAKILAGPALDPTANRLLKNAQLLLVIQEIEISQKHRCDCILISAFSCRISHHCLAMSVVTGVHVLTAGHWV